MRPMSASLLFALVLSTPAAFASDIPVFPDEDKGAAPSVSAEEGGKGFGAVAAKLGFTTNTDFEPLGDLRAKKGGEVVRQVFDYPTNFRPYGAQANTAFNYLARELMFDTLVNLHSNEVEFCPSLASHWKKSDDDMTFWFRINPNARWADGSPVTTKDVLYTFKLLVDPTLGSPSTNETYGKFEEPVCESPYIIRVKCKVKNWRNFLYFASSTYVLPAKQLAKYVEGDGKAEDWLKDYNTKFMMASGPYEMREEDQKKGERLTLRRRKDWWAKDQRLWTGWYNFDKISRVVITNQAIAFERLKKGAPGDINIMLALTSRRWVREMTPKAIPEMARGLIQKRKIFNEKPNGVSGLAINMQKAPYNDIRVRKALAYLFPLKEMLKKLMYRQYMPMRSYWPGTAFENKDNPRFDYDPKKALELLAEAGWSKRNSSGQLIDAKGEPLRMRLIYRSPGLKPHMTMYQESLKAAGITLTLELARPEELWQRVQEKKYELASMAWGALLFPNPETSYKGSLAKTINNNNITSVDNPRIDKLCEEYDSLGVEQMDRRRAIIKEIDKILAETVPYVLGWFGPYERFLFWNKFGYPEYGLPRVEDYNFMDKCWWWDEDKAKKCEAARKDPSISMEPGKISIKYWREKQKLQK